MPNFDIFNRHRRDQHDFNETQEHQSPGEQFIASAPKYDLAKCAYVLDLTIPAFNYNSAERNQIISQARIQNQQADLDNFARGAYTKLSAPMQERMQHIKFMESMILTGGDFRNLCFSLGIDYENIPGDTNLGLKLIHFLNRYSVTKLQTKDGGNFNTWKQGHTLTDATPQPESPVTFSQNEKMQLMAFLNSYFNLTEIETLMNTINENYHYFEGASKQRKVDSIVNSLSDTKLYNLALQIRKIRPSAHDVAQFCESNNISQPIGELPTEEAQRNGPEQQTEQKTTFEHRELIELRDILDNELQDSDLQSLLFNLPLNYEDLTGSKATQIVIQCKSDRALMQSFLQACVNRATPGTELYAFCTHHGYQPENQTANNNNAETKNKSDSDLDIKAIEEKIAQWAQDAHYTFSPINDTRSPEQIWSDVESSGEYPNISYNEVRSIIKAYNFDLQAIQIWATLFYREKNNNPEATYKDYVDLNAPFPGDEVIRTMLGVSRRHGAFATLKTAFDKTLIALNNIKQGKDTDLTGSKLFICSFCGTEQHVPMRDQETPTTTTCSACAGVDGLRLTGALAKRKEPEYETIERIEAQFNSGQDLSNSELSTNFRDLYKAYHYKREDLLDWASRVVLATNLQKENPRISKFPHESIKVKNNGVYVITDILKYCIRNGLSQRQMFELFTPTKGNLARQPGYESAKTRTCYCADCGDVWKQNIDGVSTVQVSDNPVYDTQEHHITQITCGNTECGSEKVFYSGDFSPSIDASLAELTEDRLAISEFLFNHFSVSEIKRLIAIMTEDDSLIEDISGDRIENIAQELFTYYVRRGIQEPLAHYIATYKFESQLSGASVAVQCQYCGRVASTKVSQEGMILLDYCQGCANIDKWTVYALQHQDNENLVDFEGNPYVPFDMYDSYMANVSETGKLPTMVHQSYLANKG